MTRFPALSSFSCLPGDPDTICAAATTVTIARLASAGTRRSRRRRGKLITLVQRPVQTLVAVEPERGAGERPDGQQRQALEYVRHSSERSESPGAPRAPRPRPTSLSALPEPCKFFR
jgi:hypothetical protein